MVKPAIQYLALCLPARDEAGSLEVLLPELDDVIENLAPLRVSLFVFDDASTDATAQVLERANFTTAELVLLRSRVQVGKAAGLQRAMRSALEAGADGILMLDADGQDDPAFIPEILAALNSGFDLVNARRVNREHPMSKRLSSRAFNATVRAVTGLKVWDINSGMKGFSRRAAEDVAPFLYGELHRVLLVIAVWLGFSVGEVSVVNRARIAGHSKYGFARGWRGLLDLVTIRFLLRYHARPGHFFSGIGAALLLTGLATWAFLFSVGALGAEWARAAQFLLAMLAVSGVLLISIGFLSELMLFLAKTPPIRVVDNIRLPPARGGR